MTEKESEMEQAPLCVGIDLGTTNSFVAFFNETTNNPDILSSGSETSIPSMICIGFDSNGKELPDYGKSAKDSNSPFIFYDSKRLIGKTYSEFKEMGNEKSNWPFEVCVQEPW